MKIQTTFAIDAHFDGEHNAVELVMSRPECGSPCYIEIVLPDGTALHFTEHEWQEFCDEVQEHHT